ncbi:MAG: amino acid ABC transporter permease [Eubacteriaceae bacterium]|nr:amino acid ABC transporter permease [Eubacteriaceae bacterium]
MSPITISFIRGTVITLALTIASIIFGIILALILAFMRMGKSKILNGFAWFYVWIFRGTPLFLQIVVINFVPPLIYLSVTGKPMPRSNGIMTAGYLPMLLTSGEFKSGIIALALNTGAYCCEIIRAGIESIDIGQHEAAKALGMSKFTAMSKVIIPQTMKRIIPPFSNEFTLILKDSSLVSTIGLTELARVSRQLSAGGKWSYLFVGAAIYLFLTTFSTFAFDKLEKYFGRYE